MPELPNVTGREAIRAFEKVGWHHDRTSGSHYILKKPGARFLLTVPVHAGKTLKRGTLKGLIDAAGLTVEEFRALL